MKKPIIFGSLTYQDCGKTLMQMLLYRNFGESLFCNNPRKDAPMIGWKDEIDISTDEKAKDLLYRVGFSILGKSSFFEKYNREQVRAFYKEMTDKPVVHVYVPPEEFERYCDVGSYMYRDIRSRWIITAHKKIGLGLYCKGLLDHYNACMNITDSNTRLFMLSFEKLIKHRKDVLDELAKFMGVKLNGVFEPATPMYDRHFTDIDLMLVELYAKKGNSISDDELDEISEVSAEYNQNLGYPSKLRKSNILYPQLLEDVDKYVEKYKNTYNQLIQREF